MATRWCCFTPRTAVDGGRWATSAPTLCRSMKRFSASTTIHTSWNCARHTGEPRQRIDTQSEGRSLETTVFKERFNTIERVFGWEDKFRHLLLRFERLSELHYAFKSLAYAMINLRHFCQRRPSWHSGLWWCRAAR